ncbi:hypothetical protein U5640_16905 [Streptomyces sp. SS7]|uniref:hypothetical protein n=1 Tax=Streptomyces sp. SS7 TaxID=3108485 RepID=UPI0030EF532D
MSRKYPKRVRKELGRKLAAAEAFVEAVTTSGCAADIEFYSCEDAERYAAMLRVFGYVNYAEDAIADHKTECAEPHRHQLDGVWTFDIRAGGPAFDGVEDPEWTVVADGKNGAEAEGRAKLFVEAELKKRHSLYFWLTVTEVENGVPSPLALYDWTDIRKAA